jgi:hypothetical protein
MQITSTPDRLSISVSGLRNLWIGLAILAVFGAQGWLVPGTGGLSTVVLAVAAVMAGLITLAALGRTSLVADRVAGQVALTRKTPFGGGTETHPLAALTGAEVTARRSSRSSPRYRCEVLLADGQRWPLTRGFGSGGGAKQAAEAINQWLSRGNGR